MEDIKTLMQAATLEELREIEAIVQNEIASRVKAEADEARKKIRELASAYGLDIESILAAPAAKGTRKPVEAKYRHPENPELTWTGRGRMPVWVTELEATGVNRESFKIA